MLERELMDKSKRDLIKQKRDALIEMTDEFADSYLDEEYKMLCRKLINKMSRKRQVPFLTGRLDIWAAAVVYALGQVNFLFDKSFEPYVSATDICDYFGTNQSTTFQKAKKIRDMFKMRYFAEEFSTEKMLEANPMNEFVMVDGIVFSVSDILNMMIKKIQLEEESEEGSEEGSEKKQKKGRQTKLFFLNMAVFAIIPIILDNLTLFCQLCSTI